jgi:hypothetical protein
VTLIVQLALAARLAPQLLVCAKSVELLPASVTPEMVSAALPVFLTVVDIAVAVEPTGVLGKLRVVGESDTMGVAVPAPVSVTVWGDPVASSVTEIVVVKLAAETGVKVAEIVQVLPAASVVPQLVVSAKSDVLAPESVMPEMFRTALPVFDSVVDMAVAVEPTDVFGKLMVVGESEATGAGAGVPVPLRATVCGDPVASSATEIEAV